MRNICKSTVTLTRLLALNGILGVLALIYIYYGIPEAIQSQELAKSLAIHELINIDFGFNEDIPTTASTEEEEDEGEDGKKIKEHRVGNVIAPAKKPVQASQFTTKHLSSDIKRDPYDVENALIFTEFRSGGTFLGEIFNQNPAIWYLFEPLSMIQVMKHCTKKYGYCREDEYVHRYLNETMDNISKKILKDYFTECQMPWAKKFIKKEWYEDAGNSVKYQYDTCLEEGICNRGRHYRFVDENYCPERDNDKKFDYMVEKYEQAMGRSAGKPYEIEYGSDKTPGAVRRKAIAETMARKASEGDDAEGEDGGRDDGVDQGESPARSRKRRNVEEECPPLDFDRAEDHCKKTRLKTAKVNRLRELKNLEDLFTENDEDYFLGKRNTEILYLVRDPRAIANSRRKMQTNPMSKLQGQNSLQHICQSMIKNLKYLINNDFINVQVIRYEDFVFSPFAKSKELLKSIGLSQPKRLIQWYNLNMGYKKTSGGYGTAREDPMIPVFGWRKDLDFETVELIQKNCRHVMKILGYNLVDEKTLLDNEFEIVTANWTQSSEYKLLIPEGHRL